MLLLSTQGAIERAVFMSSLTSDLLPSCLSDCNRSEHVRDMKILLVHNFYGSAAPSGENQVFEAERDLLIRRGHEVATYTRHSDEIRSRGFWGKMQGALATPWNFRSDAAVRKIADNFSPDVVHVHNTFPLISPSVFYAVGKKSARAITMHNYRLFCPAAISLREGRTCTECLDKHSVGPSLRYGCYRESRLATLPLALNVALHRKLGTWSKQVDAFIALSVFQRKLLVKAGLPDGKLHVKPNFYPGIPQILPWSERKPYAIFAGRLTAEKGVINLLRSWRLWGNGAPELRIAGDGDLRPELEKIASGLQVRFLGQLSGEAAQAEIAHSRLLVLPSECLEGFPMVVREAFAFGTPVAVSDIGPLPDIVKHGESGVVFKPGNPESLMDEVRKAWETPGMLERLGEGARTAFLKEYTEDVNYKLLMEIYETAIAAHKTRYPS